MLVFAKEDAQTESFVQASERASYKYSICKTSEAAMEVFLNNQPEVSLFITQDMIGSLCLLDNRVQIVRSMLLAERTYCRLLDSRV